MGIQRVSQDQKDREYLFSVEFVAIANGALIFSTLPFLFVDILLFQTLL
jgi:hypothetical protein